MEIVFDDNEQDDYETEIIDGSLTFDELLEDDYYKAEFEKRVQERLDIQNSHSDVKGGTNTMDGQVQQSLEGENTKQDEVQAAQEPQEKSATTDNPAVETTDTAQQGEEEPAKEPAREMTAEQFDTYNETLRRVSKTAKASLPDRYNAFEDAEIKALVKQQVMQGEKPNVKELAASVVTRLTHKDEPPTPSPSSETQAKTETADEVTSLKVENALLKAGINAERIEAATKLFMAEGASIDKVADFVAKYPEWQASQEGRIAFGKTPPLAGKTAPTPESPPVLNDFEKRVAEIRKQRGYDT